MISAAEVANLPTPYDRDPKRDSDSPDAWRAYGGNKGLAGAFRRGARAAIEGLTLDACPYRDHRTDRGGVTFSRAFQRAWEKGWERAQGSAD